MRFNHPKQYYPKRDRGVYRAAANPNNPHHLWGKKLVDGLKGPNLINALRWLYRERGFDSILRDLVYSENPFFKLIKKTSDWAGDYIPIKFKD